MVSVYILHIVRLTFGRPSKAAAIKRKGVEKPHNGGHDHMQVTKLVGVLAAALTSSYTLHDSPSLSLSLSPPLHYLSLIGNSLVPRPIPIPRISLCNIEILGMGLCGNMAIILIIIIIIIIARA